jgi:Uma2 family endonuclease
MNASAFIKVDKATFFKVAQRHEGRCEYVRGRVIMQSGGTFKHSQIAANFLQLVQQQLDPKRWIASGSDRGVETGETVRYPDVTAEIAGADPNSLFTLQPVIAVEVLSPSSEERDLDIKPLEYLAIPSLQAYIVAAQDEPVCLVWLRGPDGTFPANSTQVEGHASVIRIPALAVEVKLGDVFRGIC